VWWHRIAVVIDLALLWLFWPSLARGKMTWISWRELRHGKVAAAAVASLALVLFVLVGATFPGETLNRRPPIELAPTLADKLGEPFEIPRFWWYDRLFVSGIEVPENKRISLRGRRLEGAVLHNVVMKKVDFSGAQLQGAWFVDSDLRRANFGCIDEMPGAAGMVRLAGLFAQGMFETPRPECAQLQRAWFVGSELQGSSLRSANLQGSFFASADLQGALLDYAFIQGAYFADVKLDGASLLHARLQGATLIIVGLRGASLDQTFLQGALLKNAILQGVSLKAAVLDGAQLNEAYVWRADPRKVKSSAGARVTSVKTGPEDPGPGCGENTEGNNRMCNWSATRFHSLTQQITEHTPPGDWRSEAWPGSSHLILPSQWMERPTWRRLGPLLSTLNLSSTCNKTSSARRGAKGLRRM
jgi:Pentapeptide repeats (8 copies)